MKKKFLSTAIAALTILTMLTGCGSKAATDSTNSNSGDKETKAESEESGNKKLLIYTNSGGEGRKEWLIEKAKEAGFTLDVLAIGGGEILDRLIAEKNNVQADLVFGMSAIDYEKLKAEDLLVKYEPSWASEVDMSLGDAADGYYYPIVIQPLLMMHNQDMENPPKDIIDLAKPEYKDQFAVGNLGGGTPKNLYASILVRYQDPDGEYGVSEEGWEIAKQYLQNAHIIVDGEDYVGAVVEGSRPICAMWGSGVIQHQTERNYKFSLVCPEIGVPYIAEQVAVLNKGDNQDVAKEFAEWFGSAEIQSAWSERFGTIPANEKSLENVSADITEFMNAVHPQNMDWKFVSDNIENWIEKAELEFLN